KLSIPATSEETLRDLLGEILDPTREAELAANGSVELDYDGGKQGAYHVTLTRSPAGFDALFMEIEALPPPSAAKPIAPASPEAPRHAIAVAPPASPRRATAARAPDSSALRDLIQSAIAVRASDLHLATGERPTVRIDGTLRRLNVDPIDDFAATVSLDPADAARLKAGESVDLAFEVAGAGRVRVHVYPSASGPIAAVRLLPRAAPSFASLNMPLSFDDLIDLPHGLVLVCGAAGAGKSTTLAALAQEALQRRSMLLVTLEDPIEYTLTPSETSLVRRRQIGRDVRDFATGLRDALRADPEMLMLGELRDPESIALALTAAETGHLVLASMHSGSAASAIERIVDSYPTGRQRQIRWQLAESLRAVVAQRLLNRVRGEGRIPAIELLRINRGVASLIREGKTAQLATVLQSSRREGMISLERSLADRVQAGEVRAEDAYAAANDSESLAIFLSR
ncbi:MAG TPA: PilT/PilU family type 4a pilus ATPase, partial [Polyangiales bacterium]|nr:PilT/PilU family type 4a pilus ATPase [Polyangiales bacterium]